MRVKILGSAAGGGFPQWNCACANCRRVRQGTLRGRARTQTQIAFSPDPDAKAWFLVSASPDLRTQILATPELSPQPKSETHSPIAGVFLPSADVDSVMGLLHLREFQSFFVFAAAATQRILKKESKILACWTAPIRLCNGKSSRARDALAVISRRVPVRRRHSFASHCPSGGRILTTRAKNFSVLFRPTTLLSASCSSKRERASSWRRLSPGETRNGPKQQPPATWS